MKINKILNFSCVDGPGNRLVVFFQGCNFNCLYCHNPETINPASEGFHLSPEGLFKRILEARDFISGVTFSGGECSLQAEGILETGRLLKKEGIELYLDTNFSQPAAVYERLNEVVDRYIVDLKAVQEETHSTITGRSNRQILENIHQFYDKIYEVRMVVVPGINDSDEALESWIDFILSVDPILPVKLVRFRPYGVREPYDTWEIPDESMMEQWVERAQDRGVQNIYYR